MSIQFNQNCRTPLISFDDIVFITLFVYNTKLNVSIITTTKHLTSPLTRIGAGSYNVIYSVDNYGFVLRIPKQGTMPENEKETIKIINKSPQLQYCVIPLTIKNGATIYVEKSPKVNTFEFAIMQFIDSDIFNFFIKEKYTDEDFESIFTQILIILLILALYGRINSDLNEENWGICKKDGLRVVLIDPCFQTMRNGDYVGELACNYSLCTSSGAKNKYNEMTLSRYFNSILVFLILIFKRAKTKNISDEDISVLVMACRNYNTNDDNKIKLDKVLDEFYGGGVDNFPLKHYYTLLKLYGNTSQPTSVNPTNPIIDMIFKLMLLTYLMNPYKIKQPEEYSKPKIPQNIKLRPDHKNFKTNFYKDKALSTTVEKLLYQIYGY